MRRIGVISDVHGNLPALLAALRDVDRAECADVWCLGDTCTGAEAVACFELVRERCTRVLFGNHEEMVLGAALDSFSQPPAPTSPIGLATAQLELRSDLSHRLYELQPLEEVPAPGGNIVLAHGSPHRPVWHWVKSEDDVELAFAAAPEAQLLLVGHTHVPSFGLRTRTGATYVSGEQSLAGGLELGGATALVNPGSVGEPPAGMPGSWGVLSLDDDGRPRRFDWRRLSPTPTAPESNGRRLASSQPG